MATITYNTVLTTDLRDSKGCTLALVEVTGIEGTYTAGGVDINPEQFGMRSIEFIGMNNFFAFPNDMGTYDADGDWSKAVDILPTQVTNGEGGFDWKLVVFLYATDGAELPDGTPMVFHPAIPVRMMIMGSDTPPS